MWHTECSSCARTGSCRSLSDHSCDLLWNTATSSVRTPKRNSSPRCTNCCRSFFGKTCVNLRKRVNARLVCDPKKLVMAAGKATFMRSTIINSDLVLVESTRPRIMMSRPLAVGFTILELSKLVMYGAYYEQLLPCYGDDLRLCFTDTDNFIFWVKTPNLHADMADMRSTFLDTSNFLPRHPLYSDKNKKLEFFKSETGPYFCLSFVDSGRKCTLSGRQLPMIRLTHSRRKRRAEALRQKTDPSRTISARVKRMEHQDVHVSDLQIEEPRHRHSQTVEKIPVVYR